VTEGDTRYLEYIRESIDRLDRWTAVPRDSALEEELVFEAVLHRLETLADAVSHLSDALKLRHPEVPWRSIVDFRNRLAHGYLNVHPERVWDVVEVHLPTLKTLADEELGSSGSSG